jgi:hypothetical protein
MPELPMTLYQAAQNLMTLLENNIDHNGNDHADYPIRLHADGDMADQLTQALQDLSTALKQHSP